MDSGNLAFAFLSVIFPFLIAGSAALPYVSPVAPRFILISTRFLMFGLGVINLLVTVFIAVISRPPISGEVARALDAALITLVVVTIAIILWLTVSFASFLIEDALYNRSR